MSPAADSTAAPSAAPGSGASVGLSAGAVATSGGVVAWSPAGASDVLEPGEQPARAAAAAAPARNRRRRTRRSYAGEGNRRVSAGSPLRRGPRGVPWGYAAGSGGALAEARPQLALVRGG